MYKKYSLYCNVFFVKNKFKQSKCFIYNIEQRYLKRHITTLPRGENYFAGMSVLCYGLYLILDCFDAFSQ